MSLFRQSTANSCTFLLSLLFLCFATNNATLIRESSECATASLAGTSKVEQVFYQYGTSYPYTTIICVGGAGGPLLPTVQYSYSWSSGYKETNSVNRFDQDDCPYIGIRNCCMIDPTGGSDSEKTCAASTKAYCKLQGEPEGPDLLTCDTGILFVTLHRNDDEFILPDNNGYLYFPLDNTDVSTQPDGSHRFSSKSSHVGAFVVASTNDLVQAADVCSCYIPYLGDFSFPSVMNQCMGELDQDICVPTDPPTKTPTISPTMHPTSSPTLSPTGAPTMSPSALPTSFPTSSPTTHPTSSPTRSPTGAPSMGPTALPTSSPTSRPTGAPTSTKHPTEHPTTTPSNPPTVSPTVLFIPSPTNKPGDSMVDSISTFPPTDDSPADKPDGSLIDSFSTVPPTNDSPNSLRTNDVLSNATDDSDASPRWEIIVPVIVACLGLIGVIIKAVLGRKRVIEVIHRESLGPSGAEGTPPSPSTNSAQKPSVTPVRIESRPLTGKSQPAILWT